MGDNILKKPKVITIGESMVVFNPVMDISFVDSPLFMKQIAGAESNFAIGLSRLGHNVGWISRLSNDSLGNYIHHMVRGNGVDTSMIQFDDNHATGIIIKEKLVKEHTNVHYYRENSASSFMDSSIINEKYFEEAKYLFITGITPILSESCKNTIFKAIKIAKKLNINIIFDPNIRLKLIENKVEYKQLLNEIAGQVDLFLPGLNEGKFLCGHDNPESIAKYYLDLNPNMNLVIKLGENGCYYENNADSFYVSGYKVEKVIDPIGAGDAFAAGLTSGLLDGESIKDALKQANLIGSILIQSTGDIEGFPFKNQLEDYKKSICKPSIDEVNR